MNSQQSLQALMTYLHKVEVPVSEAAHHAAIIDSALNCIADDLKLLASLKNKNENTPDVPVGS